MRFQGCRLAAHLPLIVTKHRSFLGNYLHLLWHVVCRISSRAYITPRTVTSDMQRILCVDDDIVGTRIRGEILKERGYSVVLYHCPLTVLRCDLSVFDLAVLDFQMPGLNGRELFLHMRALGARFPIVLLTGCMDALSYEDRVLFARCLDKGMPIQRLLETIAEFLDPNQIPDCGCRSQR